MTKKIFEYIQANGTASAKKSVIDFFSKKDKVYTKKIEIPGDKIVINKCIIKSLSITSISGKFDDVGINDIRVNMKNPFGMWVNVYISSLPQHYIEQIAKQIGVN